MNTNAAPWSPSLSQVSNSAIAATTSNNSQTLHQSSTLSAVSNHVHITNSSSTSCEHEWGVESTFPDRFSSYARQIRGQNCLKCQAYLLITKEMYGM